MQIDVVLIGVGLNYSTIILNKHDHKMIHSASESRCRAKEQLIIGIYYHHKIV